MIQMILDIRDHNTRAFDTDYETTTEAQQIVSDILASGARFLTLTDIIIATQDITFIEFVEADDE
jgi:hypothetical protein